MPFRRTRLLMIAACVLGGGYLCCTTTGGLTQQIAGLAGERGTSDSDGAFMAIDHYDRGRTLYFVYQNEEALRAYRAALKEKPRDPAAPVARYRIAVCLGRQGKRKEAMAAYKTFLRKHRKHKLADRVRKELACLKKKQVPKSHQERNGVASRVAKLGSEFVTSIGRKVEKLSPGGSSD